MNFDHGSTLLERIHLAILSAVEERGTVTAAAQALNLTQSALSHTIKKLEQQLGLKLWLKEGRGIRFSAAGLQLLSVAKRVLPQLEHGEQILADMAEGQRGNLRIGMECHPCYQWLLGVVAPYLARWPKVELDVKQAFQFGGMAALFQYDIDLLITPDPLFKPGVSFEPVFAYELVLVVAQQHELAAQDYVEPDQLSEQILYTYPVPAQRLDIFSQFLTPGQGVVKQHKTLETTDIMLQMVAAGRGVTALPLWLVAKYQNQLKLKALRLGPAGIHKHIYLGVRSADTQIDYIHGFIALANDNQTAFDQPVNTNTTNGV